MTERFSDRYGYRGADAEITIREDAPDGLRFAVLAIGKEAGLGPKSMRETICQVLREPPNPNNWSEYPNIWEEVIRLLEDCPWHKVYDIAEALHGSLWHGFGDGSNAFEDNLNQYFDEHGIGWQMDGGKIVYRGSEAFSGATQEAVDILERTGRSAAAREIHEALRDISRRPEPDVTRAIQHVIAAMEATARDVTGEPNATFGKLVKKLDLPPPLDTAAEKLWGYPPLPYGDHRPSGHRDHTDPQEWVTVERGLPGRDCQKRNLARHPALWPGIMEALDRISCPEQDRSKDAMPQGVRGTHRHSTPRQPNR